MENGPISKYTKTLKKKEENKITPQKILLLHSWYISYNIMLQTMLLSQGVQLAQEETSSRCLRIGWGVAKPKVFL